MAVSLLCELSKSEMVCEKISELNGAILILGKVACSKAQNPALAEEAEMTLENLEKCEKNVLQMAENGRLEPLLNLLIEGAVSSLFILHLMVHQLYSVSTYLSVICCFRWFHDKLAFDIICTVLK